MDNNFFLLRNDNYSVFRDAFQGKCHINTFRKCHSFFTMANFAELFIQNIFDMDTKVTCLNEFSSYLTLCTDFKFCTLWWVDVVRFVALIGGTCEGRDWWSNNLCTPLWCTCNQPFISVNIWETVDTSFTCLWEDGYARVSHNQVNISLTFLLYIRLNFFRKMRN